MLQGDAQQSQANLTEQLKGDFNMLEDPLQNLQGDEEEKSEAISLRKDAEE